MAGSNGSLLVLNLKVTLCHAGLRQNLLKSWLLDIVHYILSSTIAACSAQSIFANVGSQTPNLSSSSAGANLK
jgi:hypothetical protein